MDRPPQTSERRPSATGNAEDIPTIAAALWPLSAHPFRDVGTVGDLLAKGIPPSPWLNSCGVYAVVVPAGYEFHVLADVTVSAARNVLSPMSPDALQSKWVAESRVVYVGLAGNTYPRSIRQQLKALLRHVVGDTTARGPHRGGEVVWQLGGHETFMVMAMATGEPPAPRELEESLLGRFAKRHGRLPFGNRVPQEAEGPIRSSSVAAESQGDGPVQPGYPVAVTVVVVDAPVDGDEHVAITAPSPTVPSKPERRSSPRTQRQPLAEDAGLRGRKSALRKNIDHAFAKAQRDVVLGAIREAPRSTTIGDIRQLFGQHGLEGTFLGMTIAELRDELGRMSTQRW